MARAMFAMMASLALFAAPLTVHADESGDSSDTPTISVERSTAVVTKSSGYRISVTIANPTGKATPEGTLLLTTNTLYTFVSRSDIQDWANGDAPIPTPNELGSATVPSIPAGGRTNVNISVAANQTTLNNMPSWGPKPLLVSYYAKGQELARTPTFLTRSSDGLDTAQTPAMRMSVVLPLTSNSWQANNTVITNLIHDVADDDAAVTLSSQPSVSPSITKHAALSIVADPSMLASMTTGSAAIPLAGIMQPSAFDITAYAAINNDALYQSAGIDGHAWSASKGQALYASTRKDSGTTDAYAWQGECPWTMDALTAARQQGYTTVIADASFDAEQSETVHTGTYVVKTSAGDVTVLKEQRTLSMLAQGKATDDQATAEASDAGRLARLVAQSAFYQMEQPYVNRHLLISFANDASPTWIDQVMSAFEQANWLQLTDLATMANTDPYAVLDTVNTEDVTKPATHDTLRELAASRHGIMRMATAVLKDSVDDATALSPQALARQDAHDISTHESDPTAWISRLLAAHDEYALHAMGPNVTTRQHMTDAARTLADQLLGAVSINPSESVSVFSESAQMPVTVSNTLPYAVTVHVKSRTDSMQIVTSSEETVSIPAHSDAQGAFIIRVSTSGKAKAALSLTDRNHQPFSNNQNTAITSVLRISDASGFIIIGFAILLGIVGLWRQFNRKKDPDE